MNLPGWFQIWQSNSLFYREIEGSLVYLLFKKMYSDVLDFHLNVCLLTCPMQATAI